MADDLEVISCVDAAAWDAWLAAGHQRQEGVQLRVAKLRSGVPSVTNDEAVDVGLCWGWISGHRKALDDTWFLQRHTPRRPGSNWSAVNVARSPSSRPQDGCDHPGRPRSRRPRPTAAGTVRPDAPGPVALAGCR